MAWAERKMNALHLFLAYVGAGSNAVVTQLATETPESHLEPRRSDGAYAVISPPTLGWLDGMKIYLHVTAYDGPDAVQRVPIPPLDGACVMLDPDRQKLLGPMADVLALQQRVKTAGRALENILLEQRNVESPFPIFKQLLTAALKDYKAGRLADDTPPGR